jgi:transcriptional regulator with XRE-family HTH domain
MDIKPIKTHRDYRRILKEIKSLMNAKRDTPKGGRLGVLVTLVEAWEARHYDIVDALAARKVEASLAAGREELLNAEETAALVAAPTPLAFWRKKRGKTQSQLAAEIGVSENFLSDLERGKAKGDVTLYGKLARCLELSINDLRSVGKVTARREAKSCADCRRRIRATRMAFPSSSRADETLPGSWWKVLSVRGMKFQYS